MNWAQKELYDNLHECDIILKARQLGITTFFSLYLLDKVLWDTNVQAGIIAHTLDDASNIFRDKLKYAFDQLHPNIRKLFRTVGDSAKELAFSHGSIIRVGTSLRSSTLQYLHISEFGKICAKSPEKAREITTGSLNTVHAGNNIFIESTAEGKEGKFYDMCQEAQKPKQLTPLDFKFFFFPWWKHPEYTIGVKVDIPTHLEEYFAKLALRGISLTDPQKWWYTKKYETQHEDMLREFPSYPDEAFQASQEGNWYAMQMKELWDTGHITNVSYDRALPVYTAWDLGQADFTAIWFFQLTRTGDINVIDYFQGRDKPIDQLTQILQSKKYTYGNCIWPSDANARDRAGITFVNQARNFGWTGIVLEQHGIRDGINLVRSTLGKCWFDQNKCKEGIACLENYKKKWSPAIGGWTSDPLHDEYSHGCFIGETLIKTSEGNKRIDSIKQGDLVLTPNGYKKVVKTFEYEADKLLKIKYKNQSVTCTSNHKFFTKNGLLYADTLRYNDILYTLKERKICQKLYGLKSSNTNIGFRENFLLVKMKAQSSLMDIVTNGMDITIQEISLKQIPLQDSIEQCGLSIMGKFQKAITFITETAIPKITTLKTWNLLALVNIPSYITQKKEENNLEFRFSMPCKKQKNGMPARKEENGTGNMGKKHGLNACQSLKHAKAVTNLIKLFGHGQNFAQTNAKQDIELKSNSILKNVIAKFVERFSGLINTLKQRHAVKSVELNLLTTQKVYDFEVEDDHCYYANGFLVSNSDAFRYLVSGLSKISMASGSLENDYKALRNYWGG